MYLRFVECQNVSEDLPSFAKFPISSGRAPVNEHAVIFNTTITGNVTKLARNVVRYLGAICKENPRLTKVCQLSQCSSGESDEKGVAAQIKLDCNVHTRELETDERAGKDRLD